MAEMIGETDAPNFLKNQGLSVHGFVYDDGYCLYGQRSNLVGYHAGKSSWDGYTGLNSSFLGVECLIDINGGYITDSDKEIMSEAVSDLVMHKRWVGSDLEKLIFIMNFKDWLQASQLDALVDMVSKWSNIYDIPNDMIVGHDMVSPNRKFDPGMEFPWELFYEKLNLKT